MAYSDTRRSRVESAKFHWKSLPALGDGCRLPSQPFSQRGKPKLAASERKEHKARRADSEWRMASDFPLKYFRRRSFCALCVLLWQFNFGVRDEPDGLPAGLDWRCQKLADFFGGLCRPATRVSVDTHDERVGLRRRVVMISPETTNSNYTLKCKALLSRKTPRKETLTRKHK
jgi:hypothetical protein